MPIQKYTAALLAVLTLGTGSAMAAPQLSHAPEGFVVEVEEAKMALWSNMAPIDRPERAVAEQHLTTAESLYRQGKMDKAHQYLEYARGILGVENRH